MRHSQRAELKQLSLTDQTLLCVSSVSSASHLWKCNTLTSISCSGTRCSLFFSGVVQ